MGGLVWKTFFISLGWLFIVTNIAFAFNLLQEINPTSLSGDYTNSYFGISSFLDVFNNYFGNQASHLFVWKQFLTNYSEKIKEIFNLFVLPFRVAFRKLDSGDIIAMILGIIMFINSVIPMVMMFFYGLCFIIYLFMFAFTIVLFIFAFFGGAFSTPIPSTDWFEYQGDWPWIENSYRVITTCLLTI